MNKTTEEYLKDISFCIERIETHTENISFEDYVSNIDKIDCVERNFIKIGDTIERIPEEIQTKHKEIPWGQIKSFRNKLTHEYPDVKNHIVWRVIKNDLPTLKTKIEEVRCDIKTKEHNKNLGKVNDNFSK